jgi:hypothetical protein
MVPVLIWMEYNSSSNLLAVVALEQKMEDLLAYAGRMQRDRVFQSIKTRCHDQSVRKW